MKDLPDKIIFFAEFELDTVYRRLLRGGETIALHARAFDLLTFLVSNNGRIVSKDEILDAVWEGSFVEESNLVVQISNLRKVLGETKNAPRFLVTVPGKGYKFAADTNENLLTVETHSVSELTIEHEEEIEREEIGFENHRLLERNNWSRKWLSVVGIASLVILTVGAIGYFRFQKNGERENYAFGWTNPSLRESPRQLTANGKINVAAISPDGMLYAYTNEGSELAGLWTAGVGDSQPVQMTNKPSRGIEVSPDGKMFASFHRPMKGDKLKLAVFSIEGGEPLYSFDAAADLLYEKLRWSPDGRSLVYAFYNSTAWRQKISGGEPEKFLEFAGENINAFSWSFDGRKFAVAHGQELRDVVLFTIER